MMAKDKIQLPPGWVAGSAPTLADWYFERDTGSKRSAAGGLKEDLASGTRKIVQTLDSAYPAIPNGGFFSFIPSLFSDN
jgi:hypothetical protein